MMSSSPDGRLVLARAGDVDAFESLIRECDDGMRALVYSVVRDSWLMDDVLQVAYEKAFRKIATFQGHSSFRTWLHRVCWTTAIDALRAEGRRQDVSIENAEYAPTLAPGPECDTIARMTWDDAWGQLSDEQRSALVLVVGEELTYEEAAEVCGARPGTIASRVSRARVRLWEVLDDGPLRSGIGSPSSGGCAPREVGRRESKRKGTKP